MQAARDSLRPTRQRRSQRSLERILEALDGLIEEKTFEEITVSEVCTRAGIAVGTFYDRVGKKEALLEHLRQRFYAEMIAQIEQAFAPQRFAQHGLAQMLEINAREMVTLHRRRRGAIRAIVVEARRSAAFAVHARQFNALLHDRVTRCWLSKREEFAGDDPEQTARHGFLLGIGFLREAVIWQELWPPPSDNDEDDERAIASNLARTLTCFLTHR